MRSLTVEEWVKTEGGSLVPAYVGSDFGFNKPGIGFLDDFHKQLAAKGVYPLDPFAACAEFLPPAVFNQEQQVGEQLQIWKKFNSLIGYINYGVLMPRAKFMVALLEGYPPDEGLSSEIAYFASNFGQVLGVKSDFRLAENPAASANPAVTFFMRDRYQGEYFEGPNGYDQLYVKIFELTRDNH